MCWLGLIARHISSLRCDSPKPLPHAWHVRRVYSMLPANLCRHCSTGQLRTPCAMLSSRVIDPIWNDWITLTFYSCPAYVLLNLDRWSVRSMTPIYSSTEMTKLPFIFSLFSHVYNPAKGQKFPPLNDVALGVWRQFQLPIKGSNLGLIWPLFLSYATWFSTFKNNNSIASKRKLN